MTSLATQPRVVVPQRIQLSRTAGFRLQEVSRALNGLRAAKVDRSTMFGNPFPVDIYGREVAVDLFRRWLTGNMSTFEMMGLSREDRWSSGQCPMSVGTVRRWMLDDLHKLRGKNLACWCKGEPCHADALLCLANEPPR